MASFPAITLLLLKLTLLLLLSSVQATDLAHSPHSLPFFAPAPAPKPHKGHHYHHHPPTPPPVHTPTHSPPVHPPVKPPVHPPVKPPVHPPVKPPAHPPVKPPVHPPVKPPVYPPVKPPVKPPVYPPVKPPVKPYPHPVPKRKLLAVQGVVYCKPCIFIGIDTVWKAKPLEGAVVRISCNNTKYKPVVAEAKTDKNGYFYILPEKVTTAAYHKCKVFLVKSPTTKCNVPTNIKDGWKGATLTPAPTPPKPPSGGLNPIYQLFNVGPFAFEPSKKLPCPR